MRLGFLERVAREPDLEEGTGSGSGEAGRGGPEEEMGRTVEKPELGQLADFHAPEVMAVIVV